MHTANSNTISAVDRLGALHAQLAPLLEREKALKAEIIAAGPGAYEGDFYRAVASRFLRQSLSLEGLPVWLRWLAKRYAKTSWVDRVNVYDRQGGGADLRKAA